MSDYLPPHPARRLPVVDANLLRLVACPTSMSMPRWVFLGYRQTVLGRCAVYEWKSGFTITKEAKSHE